MQEVLPDNSSEIVIRDQNGDPSVQIPLLPPLEEDQIQDEETTEKESVLSNFMDRLEYVANRGNRDRGPLTRDVQGPEYTAW